MRSAVIGHGIIGKYHANILRDMGYLCAVCDVDKSALEDLDGVELYGDYIELLDKAKPETVHICTPHYLHADMVIEALKRDVNVLCEKPLCIREEDIDRILEAEKNSKAKLGVCHQNRYNPTNLFVKDYLKDKKVLGGVGQMSWCRDAKYYASAEWRGKWDSEGGGVLINQALHTLDLMQWFCGMPESLSASISNLTLDGVIEVEDTAAICSRGEAGFNFYASNGCIANLPVEITLSVEGTTVKIMPKYVTVGTQMFPFDIPKPKEIKECYGSGHGTLIKDFYNCLSEGRNFEIDGAEGSKVVKLILAAYRSGGKNVEIK